MRLCSFLLLVLGLSTAQECITATTVSSELDVVYTPANYPQSLRMDIRYPSNIDLSETLPCGIFVHGGLWQGGSKGQSNNVDFAENVVKASRTIVANIEYRVNTNNNCCSGDKDCNYGTCDGTCIGSYPSFTQDAAIALAYLQYNYSRCNSQRLYCYGHSAGGQICADLALNMDQYIALNLNYKGFVGIQGIYNFTKFYAGPLGGGYECSIEKAFGSDGTQWCSNGDTTCNPNLFTYSQPKGLFVHSPHDTWVLDQQAKEMTCRMNGMDESQCFCNDYYSCPCLSTCLGDYTLGSIAKYTSATTGEHYPTLSTIGLADIVKAFVCTDSLLITVSNPTTTLMPTIESVSDDNESNANEMKVFGAFIVVFIVSVLK